MNEPHPPSKGRCSSHAFSSPSEVTPLPQLFHHQKCPANSTRDPRFFREAFSAPSTLRAELGCLLWVPSAPSTHDSFHPLPPERKSCCVHCPVPLARHCSKAPALPPPRPARSSECLAGLPVLHSNLSAAIYLHRVVYMSLQLSPFIPLSPSPTVFTSLFFKSPFLPCKCYF